MIAIGSLSAFSHAHIMNPIVTLAIATPRMIPSIGGRSEYANVPVPPRCHGYSDQLKHSRAAPGTMRSARIGVT